MDDRCGNVSEKDRVLKAVTRVLNKLTPENYVWLKNQLINHYCITTADILKGVVSLIVDKALSEPTFCSVFAMLCSDLHCKLPPFPGGEPGDRPITFKRLLLNRCQEAFEGPRKLMQETETTDEIKLRRLGSVRLIGELVNQKMVPEMIIHRIALELLGHDDEACPEEENIEALCQFLSSMGKHLDEGFKSKRIADTYFNRLNELSTNNTDLPPRLRFMVRDVLDLRSNNWVGPRRGPVAVGPVVRLGPEDLEKKTTSLLEEYFSTRLLGEAMKCVEELRSPSYHPEIVKESISLSLEKNPPMAEPVFKLLEYLLTKNILGSYDIRTGCVRYASLLADLAIDLPRAPFHFGSIIGKLVLVGGLDFDAVRDVIAKFEDDGIRSDVFRSVMDVFGFYLSGNSQAGYVVAA